MRSQDSRANREANWLLAALPDTAYNRVLALCETVDLAFKEVVIHPETPIEYAYFPQKGCLSMVTVMGDGSAVEVGTIGWEGMAGVSLAHGVNWIASECIVQVAGSAHRIATAALEAELREHEELGEVLRRYAQVWAEQIGRGSSCNGVHDVQERCARWLLMTQDRVELDELPLTHEFLGIMLGVRRASVTLAAEALSKAGVINYKRGRITVLDRGKLEAASCECYAAMQAIYAKLLSVPAGNNRPTA